MSITLLTREEWHAKRAPFFTMKVPNNWSVCQREIIGKWIEAHCGAGWVYWDGDEMYVFEQLADRTIFKMWIVDDPLADLEGSVEP